MSNYNSTTVYIDLDGVCADFNSKCIELTGKPYQGKETWKVLEKVPRLFSTLDILEGTENALAWIEQYFHSPNVEFLTALPLPSDKLYSSQRDKVEWCKYKLGSSLQVNCVQNWSFKKYFVRSTQDILIDDSLRNCKEWELAGCIAILHTDWDTTIDKLKKY